MLKVDDMVITCAQNGSALSYWMHFLESREGTSERIKQQSTEKAMKLANAMLDDKKLSASVALSVQNKVSEWLAVAPIIQHWKDRLIIVLDREQQMELQQAGNMMGWKLLEFSRLLVKLTGFSITNGKPVTMKELTDKGCLLMQSIWLL